MIALLQRVRTASVTVEDTVVGRIERGVLALIGVQPADDAGRVRRLLERLLTYRMFNDDAGRMNRSVRDIAGGLLLVPQFTLAADTRSGTRPSFSSAATPDQARAWFEHLVQLAREQHDDVATGVFGADMQVALINDGPVTFWLEA